MINLEWLRTFSSIFEYNSITAASKKLHMTQPGVSKHLSALEHHIGKKLFDRTTRKISPTEYGKFLYAQITNPIKELEKVEYYSNLRTKKKRSAISIGCTTDFFKKQLLNKIYAFDMYVVTFFGEEEELIEALEKGKVQLLVGVKKYQAINHELTFLSEGNLCLVTSNDLEIPKELASDKKQLTKWVQKQTWFVYSNNLKDVNEFWNANFNIDLQLIPRYILPSYIDIIEALKNNNGLAIIPQYLCNDSLKEGLIQLPFPTMETVNQKLFYAHKLKDSNLEAIKLFKERLNSNTQE